METIMGSSLQYPPQHPPVDEPPVVVERETVSKTESRTERDGVLSTTIHLIGEIIALPFRLVGGLIRLIF